MHLRIDVVGSRWLNDNGIVLVQDFDLLLLLFEGTLKNF